MLSDGGEHGTVLLRSAATVVQQISVAVPGAGTLVVEQYDGAGRRVATGTTGAAGKVTVPVPVGGFTNVRR